MVNTVSALMVNIAFALSGLIRGLNKLKSSIITNSIHQVIPMVRIPTHRPPTHPGEMLLEEFLTPLNLTQKDLANAILVPYQRVNEIINQRRGVTPSTALRLAKFFDISPDFWLNLQLRWDLYHAQQEEQQILSQIASGRKRL